jgi:hypothetical protein
LAISVFDIFTSAISPLGARINQLPPIVLVFGGPLGNPNKSAREMFNTWAALKHPTISSQIRTPEEFADWNSFKGYGNLVDFEIDAGNLARAIVLFSESPGSFAELGAFCTNSALAERLFVVVAKEHYQAISFIAYGPLKKIEDLKHDHSICVLDSLDPKKIQDQLPDVFIALEEKLGTLPKTLAFQPLRHRDQFLLVADLVDLFGALTERELHGLVKNMGADIDHPALSRITSQLLRFELIAYVPGVTKRFFVAPIKRLSYLNYASPKNLPAFDRARFKLVKAMPWLMADKLRYDAYCEIHAKAMT